MPRPETTGRKPLARLAYSVREFCEMHGISESQFYELKRLGLAPAQMDCGRRKPISDEAARQWRAEREAALREAQAQKAASPETPSLPGHRSTEHEIA